MNRSYAVVVKRPDCEPEVYLCIEWQTAEGLAARARTILTAATQVAAVVTQLPADLAADLATETTGFDPRG